MKQITLVVATVFLILLASCGKDERNPQDSTLEILKVEDQKLSADTTGIPYQVPGETKQGDIYHQQYDWDKKIVKTATLLAEVIDYKRFLQQSGDVVKQYGGYISQEVQRQDDFKIENTITIKVPVNAFEETANTLLKLAEKTEQRQISTDDVTADYVDGKARLEAKKQVRLRYLELLKQAKNMAEILSVQQELNSIQEEIERVTGRLNYLGQSAAMSSIHLTYYQLLKPSGSRGNSFISKLSEAFNNGWKWLVQVIIGLTSIWPLLFLGIVILLLFKESVFKIN